MQVTVKTGESPNRLLASRLGYHSFAAAMSQMLDDLDIGNPFCKLKLAMIAEGWRIYCFKPLEG